MYTLARRNHRPNIFFSFDLKIYNARLLLGKHLLYCFGYVGFFLNGNTNSSQRTLARRSFSTLRGSDGSIVAGACVTRVSDGRATVIAEDLERVDSNTSCAHGDLLAAAGRASTRPVRPSEHTPKGAFSVDTQGQERAPSFERDTKW